MTKTQNAGASGRSNSISYLGNREETNTDHRHVSNSLQDNKSDDSTGSHAFSGYANPHHGQSYDERHSNPLKSSSSHHHRQHDPNPSIVRASDDLTVPGPAREDAPFYGSRVSPHSYEAVPSPWIAQKMNVFPGSTASAPSRPYGWAPRIPENMVSRHIADRYGPGSSHAPRAASSTLRATAFQTENASIVRNPTAPPFVPAVPTPNHSSNARTEGAHSQLRGHAPFFTPTVIPTSRDYDRRHHVESCLMALPSTSMPTLRSGEPTPEAAEHLVRVKPVNVSPTDIVALLQDGALTRLQSLNHAISTTLRSTLVAAHGRHVALEATATAKQKQITADLMSLSSQERHYEKHIAELYARFVRKMTQAIDPAYAKEKEALQRDAIQAITMARQLSSASMACRAEFETCRLKLQSATDSVARSSTHLNNVVLAVIAECLARHGASAGQANPEETSINEVVTEPADKITSPSEVAKRASVPHRKNKKKASKGKKKDAPTPGTTIQTEGLLL